VASESRSPDSIRPFFFSEYGLAKAWCIPTPLGPSWEAGVLTACLLRESDLSDVASLVVGEPPQDVPHSRPCHGRRLFPPRRSKYRPSSLAAKAETERKFTLRPRAGHDALFLLPVDKFFRNARDGDVVTNGRVAR